MVSGRRGRSSRLEPRRRRWTGRVDCCRSSRHCRQSGGAWSKRIGRSWLLLIALERYVRGRGALLGEALGGWGLPGLCCVVIVGWKGVLAVGECWKIKSRSSFGNALAFHLWSVLMCGSIRYSALDS